MGESTFALTATDNDTSANGSPDSGLRSLEISVEYEQAYWNNADGKVVTEARSEVWLDESYSDDPGLPGSQTFTKTIDTRRYQAEIDGPLVVRVMAKDDFGNITSEDYEFLLNNKIFSAYLEPSGFILGGESLEQLILCHTL